MHHVAAIPKADVRYFFKLLVLLSDCNRRLILLSPTKEWPLQVRMEARPWSVHCSCGWSIENSGQCTINLFVFFKSTFTCKYLTPKEI